MVKISGIGSCGLHVSVMYIPQISGESLTDIQTAPLPCGWISLLMSRNSITTKCLSYVETKYREIQNTRHETQNTKPDASVFNQSCVPI